MPNSYFEVIGQLNPASQLDIIQLKEITPSVTSVKEPFNQPANINPPSVIDTSNKISQLLSKFIPKSKSSDVSSTRMPLESSMVGLSFLFFQILKSFPN